MKVICFGNLGYVGTVVDRYLEKKFDYFGFDNRYFEDCKIKPFEGISNQIYGDVRNFSECSLKGFDSLIYLAALSNDPIGEEFSKTTYQINETSALRLAKVAKNNGLKSLYMLQVVPCMGKVVIKLKKNLIH